MTTGHDNPVATSTVDKKSPRMARTYHRSATPGLASCNSILKRGVDDSTTRAGGRGRLEPTEARTRPGRVAALLTRLKSQHRALSAAVTVAAIGVAGFSIATPARAAYGLQTFSNRTIDANEAPYTIAGGHPDQNVTEFRVSYEETLNGTYVDPPLGFIGNPAAAPRCPIARIPVEGAPDVSCPAGSQVGVALVTINYNGIEGQDALHSLPLYNVPPERGYPAQFAFKVESTPTVISVFPQPRAKAYGLTVGSPNIPAVGARAASIVFFGTPSQHGSGTTDAPFLSNPVDCSATEPTWRIAVDSVEHAGALRELGVPDLSDPDWHTASEPAPPVTGCEDPALASQFRPTIATAPLQGGGLVQADSPAGLAVDLDFPQSNDPTNPLSTFDPSVPQAPEPKDITVTLPAGLSISPSSAAGLGACSDLSSSPAGDQVHYDDTQPVTCPDSAKIGSAVATTPLLATHEPVTDKVIGPEPIDGSVYLLAPHPGDLPIGGGEQAGRYRLLIQLENERYGVNIKLPGVATANPQTGQLTAVFTENPQLPASHITVALKEGPRAPLATPVTCGTFTTTTDLVPWSTPGTPDANPTASFAIGSGPGGSGCVGSPGQRHFAPVLAAGTESSRAGASSPFVLRLTRADGEGELSSLEATLPKGLAAKFAGVPYCSDAALAAAAARSATEEQANPTCPASRIGSVTVGAGPGSDPFYAHGSAYLAGPYKGAPMSVAVITPAVAGPFDLGTVVVRNALFVDPETAQGRVVSDPFPKILDGVPLRLRSVEVRLDRQDFTLNPTNCEPMSVNAKLTSTDGASSSPTVPFQVGGCKALGFKPQLKLSLKGSTKHAGHPALRAVLTYPKGSYANIARAQVNLPHSEFIDQGNLNKTCTKPVLLAGACPASSIYGRVRAWTPLLEKPLEGPVYLVGGYGYKLPALVAELNGQIKVLLVGKVDSGKNHGIRNTFEAVPDAPVERFELNLKGGPKYSLLENSEDLCSKPQKALVAFTAQNGMVSKYKPLIANECGKKKHKKHGKGKGQKGGHQKAAGKGGGGHKRIATWLTGAGF